ncbi:group 3 secretory phospholipase A2-like [Osmerus mordax]|uniref:group 3 secretory phospholipase A2-like n=1 Tax=Osmerus mordax TaxID=8014 RepID=UPI00350F02C7
MACFPVPFYPLGGCQLGITAKGECLEHCQNKTQSLLRLYHLVWSNEHSMVNCVWNDESSVTANYLDLCWKREGEFTGRPDSHFEINMMLESCAAFNPRTIADRTKRSGKRHIRSADGHYIVGASVQKLHGDSDRSGGKTHRRLKRGFIVPGTLWCGAGNKALSYKDLGVFSDTDSCCREHDQCQDTILSFQYNYGVFNKNIFTMSHCNCDNKFRECLLAAQDRISNVVGYTFFNLLKMKCFDFSYNLQCVKRNWFGMCLEEDMALYAVVHPATVYNYSNTDSEEDDMATAAINITITSNAKLTPDSQKSRTSDSVFFPTSDVVTHTRAASPGLSASAPSSHTTASASPTLSSSDPAIHTSAPPSASSYSTAPASPASHNSAPAFHSTPAFPASHTEVSDSPTISATTEADGSSQALTTLESETASMPVCNQETDTMPFQIICVTHTMKANFSNKLVERVTANIDKPQSCEVYHDLDTCSLKIPPQQERYSFYNSESRSLYHCNCTSRLFQRLGQQRKLSGLLPVLLEDVSQSCFTLQPQHCTQQSSCTAVLVQPLLSQLEQQQPSGGEMVEGRHLEIMRLQVRRRNMRRTKRKGRPVRLYKQCLRMTQTKTKKLHQQGAHSSLS